MALRFYDGFDYSSTTAAIFATQMQGRGWAATPTAPSNASAGRFSGKSFSSIVGPLARYDLASGTPATAVIGHALNFNAAGVWSFGQFTDSGTVQCGVGLDASRKLFVYRSTTSTILATGTTVYPVNTWMYVEFKATINNTTGVIEVRVNGSSTPEITASSLNTRATANNSLNGFSLGIGNGLLYDDIYFLDTTGSAPTNDFLGDVRVQSLFPSGAGSSTQWTPLSSTNFSNVDDAGLDGDTTYNSSSTPGQIDLFAMGDLSGTPAAIYSAALHYDARKDDAGTRQVRGKLKSGATTVNGTTQTLPSSYNSYRDVYDTDPNTGIAWTVSGINAVEAGYEEIA